MSTEVIYKVSVRREGNIVRALALACSSNTFPKPRPEDEPDWEIFAADPATPEGLSAIVERVTGLARSADGGCIKERGRYYCGPAYFRLWRRRLRRVAVELPEADPAAVRYDRVAIPEERKPRVSYAEYLGQNVEFGGAVLRCRSTDREISKLIVLGRDPAIDLGRALEVVEGFDDEGALVRHFQMTWARLYTLLRRHRHVLRKALPGVYSGPALIRVGAAAPAPLSLPPADDEHTDERLDALQGAVGGCIEVVYGNDGREIYVNEDGIGLGLARNELATMEARASGAIGRFDWIKGPAVIIPAQVAHEDARHCPT